MIDWEKTKAWGEGGYYARIFLNVEGREPLGCVPKEAYEDTRKSLKTLLESIPDEKGKAIGTVAHRPEDIYREVKNIAPDLVVYFGNLDWRSAGTVGHEELHLFENDTGPDDANHAQHGIFIATGQDIPEGPFDDAQIYDITPSILDRMGLLVPDQLVGRPLFTQQKRS